MAFAALGVLPGPLPPPEEQEARPAHRQIITIRKKLPAARRGVTNAEEAARAPGVLLSIIRHLVFIRYYQADFTVLSRTIHRLGQKRGLLAAIGGAFLRGL
jgi:hypothetical protein